MPPQPKVWSPDMDIWMPRYPESGRPGLTFSAKPKGTRTPGGGGLWDLRVREQVAANRATFHNQQERLRWQRTGKV